MATKYRTSVKHVVDCGEGIVQLTFERPEGYEFSAGQWFRLTLESPIGAGTQTFSHASSPAMANLDMATRLSASPFKHALAALRPGDTVEIAGPGGRLRIPEGADAPVVLTGGVGVTPIRSLLLDAADTGRTFTDAVVLYGNRSAQCAPFLDELSALGRIGIRVVPVYEHPPEGWAGESGFITADMVSRHVDDVSGRTFIVTGPPIMVSAMDGVMDTLGVAAEDRVVERFTG